MKENEKSRLEKYVGRPLGVICVAAWWIQAGMQMNSADYPLRANVSRGQVVPFQIKGKIVYLTKIQYETIHWLFWVSIVSFAVLFVVWAVDKQIKTKKSKN